MRVTMPRSFSTCFNIWAVFFQEVSHFMKSNGEQNVDLIFVEGKQAELISIYIYKLTTNKIKIMMATTRIH